VSSAAAEIRWRDVRRMRRAAPKNWFLRGSLALLVAATAAAWFSGQIEARELFTPRRWQNLTHFLQVEAIPFPLREQGFSLAGLGRWVAGIWNDRGAEATLATLCIAIAAIVLAAGLALALGPLATRTLSTPEPYLRGGGSCPGSNVPWRLVSGGTRLGFVLLRAMPEYVLAYFLVALLPRGAWPAVLALAVHNGGILGRLYGDTLENLDARPLRSLSMLGASRRQLTLIAAIPMALPRFLLYFFYRFETCVREATVLGMLGIASLGHEVVEARARHFYDELLLLAAFGAGIVLLGDLSSQLVRGWVRRAR
jgi:phosphonate transport system permease protein